MSPPSEGKGGKSDVSWPSNDGRAPRVSTIWTERLPGVGVSTSESRNEGLGVGRICRACGRGWRSEKMIFLPGGGLSEVMGGSVGIKENVCGNARKTDRWREEKKDLVKGEWLNLVMCVCLHFQHLSTFFVCSPYTRYIIHSHSHFRSLAHQWKGTTINSCRIATCHLVLQVISLA